jgi:hypothetical protein
MTTLLLVFIILAAFALLWWGVNQLTLPQPFKVVILVVLGMLMLAYIYGLVSGHPLVTLR